MYYKVKNFGVLFSNKNKMQAGCGVTGLQSQHLLEKHRQDQEFKAILSHIASLRPACFKKTRFKMLLHSLITFKNENATSILQITWVVQENLFLLFIQLFPSPNVLISLEPWKRYFNLCVLHVS